MKPSAVPLPLAALLVFASLAAAPVARSGCLPARELFAVREAAKVPFRQPADFVLSGERLYVLDDLNGRVVALDLRGRVLDTLPLPGGSAVAYMGVGYGGADQLFLAAPVKGTVVVMDLKGRMVREFATGEGGKPSHPAGVLVSRGSCFVSDNEGHRIRAFSLEGSLQSAWGEIGEAPQQLRAPFRLAQDSLERLLVSDSLNSRIQIFTPKGEPLGRFGEFGTREGTFFRPSGIAVLEGDLVLVADNYFGSLQLFDSQGAYRGVLCGAEGRPLAMSSPISVAARGRNFFVLEMGTGTVRGFEIPAR